MREYVNKILNNVRECWGGYVVAGLISLPLLSFGSIIYDKHRLENSDYVIKGTVNGVSAFGFNDDSDPEIDRVELVGFLALAVGRTGVGTMGIRRTVTESEKDFKRVLDDLMDDQNLR